MTNITIDKFQFKRGNEANVPSLDSGEPFISEDSHKLLVGTPAGNIEFAKKSDVDANTTNIASNTSSLADITTVNNHSITYGYDANGNVQTVTEKDSSNNVIKTVTYTYNAVGDVTSSVTVLNGKTVTTTYNYDTSGNITSTSNVIS